MSSADAPRPRAAFLGDVIGSRASNDRQALHDTLARALAAVSSEVDTVDDLQVTAGDAFGGSFASVGEALYAALLLRLRLTPRIDIRIGVGWGEVTVLDAAQGHQDGPAWWAARTAIEWVETQQASAGWQSIRSAYRRADPLGTDTPGPTPEAVNAALMCQDHLIGLLDQRSRHILEGLMHGRTQVRLATELGLTRQAVNQRRRQDGLAVVLAAAEQLRTLE